MSSDRNERNESARSDLLRGALRDVVPGQRLCVRTVDEGDIHGRFAELGRETLVLSLSAEGDLEARIPVATILGVDAIRHCSREGAAIAAVLATVLAAMPFFWLTSLVSETRNSGGLVLLLGVFALAAIALVAAVGALIGTAFEAHEPLAVTKAARATA